MGVTNDPPTGALEPARRLDVRRVQRYAFAARLLGDRQVLVVGEPAGDGCELLRQRGCGGLLAPTTPPPWVDLPQAGSAIVCLDDAAAGDPERLFEGLAAAAAVGRAVVVSLRGASGSDPSDVTGVAYEAAIALTAKLPGAILLAQVAAEGSILRRLDVDVDAVEPVEAELVLPDGVDAEDAQHYLWVAGLDGEVTAETSSAALQVAVTPAASRRVRLLEAANAALLRTNARLGRELPGRSGAAAIGELARLERTLAAAEGAAERARAAETEADRRRIEAERRIEALHDRLQRAEQLAAAESTRAIDAEARVKQLEVRANEAEQRVAQVEVRAEEAERWALGLDARLATANDRRAVRAANRVARLLRR